MRFLFLLLSAFILFTSEKWETDFEQAKITAAREHRYILLNFSGSDWCGPCIRMHKEIFDSEVFNGFATEKLVLVQADFRRLKKNRLPVEMQKKNEDLAGLYNRNGIFPMTLLLSAEGKVLMEWESYPNMNAAEFTSQLKKITDAGR